VAKDLWEVDRCGAFTSNSKYLVLVWANAQKNLCTAKNSPVQAGVFGFYGKIF
jgi:hypothetical protein